MTRQLISSEYYFYQNDNHGYNRGVYYSIYERWNNSPHIGNIFLDDLKKLVGEMPQSGKYYRIPQKHLKDSAHCLFKRK